MKLANKIFHKKRKLLQLLLFISYVFFSLSLLKSKDLFALDIVGDLSEKYSKEIADIIENMWKEINSNFEHIGIARGWNNFNKDKNRKIQLKMNQYLNQNTMAISSNGIISLRSISNIGLSNEVITAIRHEVVHEWLFEYCPAFVGNELFHETLAIILSNEMSLWDDLNYTPIYTAKSILENSKSFQTKTSREALIRVLKEIDIKPKEIPSFLLKKLDICAEGGKINENSFLKIDDIFSNVEYQSAFNTNFNTNETSFIILNRYSANVIASKGDIKSLIQFGSTLKPFLVAGSTKKPPNIISKTDRKEWLCEKNPSTRLWNYKEALSFSCNGYFQDWAKIDPSIVSMGIYGEILHDLGMSKIPNSIEESIGLVANTGISLEAIAKAYRILSFSRPDIIYDLLDTAVHGTLSNVTNISADALNLLKKISIKTGTVTDFNNNVKRGLIIGVSNDLVIVMTVSKKRPITFVKNFYEIWNAFDNQEQNSPVNISTFDLVSLYSVNLNCPSNIISLSYDSVDTIKIEKFHNISLSELVLGRSYFCAKSSWLVNIKNSPYLDRNYDGIFSKGALFANNSFFKIDDSNITNRKNNIFFTTALYPYTKGVVIAEADMLDGNALSAFSMVISHNAKEKSAYSERHKFSVCDNTHCQLFLGTKNYAKFSDKNGKRSSIIIDSINNRKIPKNSWLMFSSGGNNSWSKKIKKIEVEKYFKKKLVKLWPDKTNINYSYLDVEFDSITEIIDRTSCESIRLEFNLPSCPEQIKIDENVIIFEGKGKSHGFGLDISELKFTKNSVEDILKFAYGSDIVKNN